ncbi:MAG: lysine--tRNA ligase, partial [Burkholderiales bacterium]|nr:lysine--tRNA ligase [Burkholderiales bacterium]
MSDDQSPLSLDENQLMAERRAKLVEIRKQGVAFPNDFERKHLSGDLHAKYDGAEKEQLDADAIEVSVAGRMMLKRVMG